MSRRPMRARRRESLPSSCRRRHRRRRRRHLRRRLPVPVGPPRVRRFLDHPTKSSPPRSPSRHRRSHKRSKPETISTKGGGTRLDGASSRGLTKSRTERKLPCPRSSGPRRASATRPTRIFKDIRTLTRGFRRCGAVSWGDDVAIGWGDYVAIRQKPWPKGSEQKATALGLSNDRSTTAPSAMASSSTSSTLGT